MTTLTPDQINAIGTGNAPTPIITVTRASTSDSARLPIGAGDLTLDGGSFVRAELRATVPAEMAPTSWQSLLIPADTLVTVEYDLGVGPLIRCAQLWLEQSTTLQPDGTTELVAQSRSVRVTQAGFPPGNRGYSGYVTQVVPQIVVDCLGVTVPTIIVPGLPVLAVSPDESWTGDPWAVIEQLMDSIGGETYFDEYGNLTLRPVPTGVGPADHYLATGPGGVITTYTSSLVRAPNRQYLNFTDATGVTADRVGVATATGSALWDGPYGRYAATEDRTGRLDQVAANSAAAAYLQRTGGVLRQLDMELVPYPGINVGDTVQVKLSNGPAELHRVTYVSLGLTPGSNTRITTRGTPWQ